MPAALSRRAVLAGAFAAAAAAACTSGSTPTLPSPTPTPPTKEQLTRMAAVAREEELGRLAKVALGAHPAMTGAKSTVTFSAQHVQALSETLVPSPHSSSPGGSVSQTRSSGQIQNQPNRAASARSLATALLDAAAAHRAAATSAPSDLARLLVSVAASDSALAAVLQRTAA